MGDQGFPAGLGEWGDLFNFGGQIFVGSVRLVGSYLGEALGLSTELLNAFITAPPIPIPGLPDCSNAPLLHELCAIWYIMDWTFFAPNTPGALIVPLLNVLMIISMATLLIKLILRVVRRAEKVTDA